MMTFETAVKTCLSKYAVFDGRASRAEFWWFQLLLVLMHVVAMVVRAVVSRVSAISYNGLDNDIVAASGGAVARWSESVDVYVVSVVPLFLFLALIVPSASSAARRLNDSGAHNPEILLLLTFAAIVCSSFLTVILYFIYINRLESLFSFFIFPFISIFIIGINSPLIIMSIFCLCRIFFFLIRPSYHCENAYGPAPHDDLTRR